LTETGAGGDAGGKPRRIGQPVPVSRVEAEEAEDAEIILRDALVRVADEAHAFGDYLKKGGFVIFDDFRGPADWENFRATMQRVLPGEQPTELSLAHPIFHAFFDIPTLDFVQYYDRGKPIFYGMFENNDPTKPSGSPSSMISRTATG
jgi:hypothetical protein